MKLLQSLILLIFMIFLIVNCNNKTKGSSLTNEEVIPLSFSKVFNQNIDTSIMIDDTLKYDTVLNNNSYLILSALYQEDVGSIIIINDKKKKRLYSIDEGASYFAGVIDSFIIIDSGTSSSRGISIYNMNSLNLIFNGSYNGELVYENKLIKFYTGVDIVDSTKRPKCPDKYKNYEYGLGYLELQIINLKDLTLTKTGKYECCIFE